MGLGQDFKDMIFYDAWAVVLSSLSAFILLRYGLPSVDRALKVLKQSDFLIFTALLYFCILNAGLMILRIIVEASCGTQVISNSYISNFVTTFTYKNELKVSLQDLNTHSEIFLWLCYEFLNYFKNKVLLIGGYCVIIIHTNNILNLCELPNMRRNKRAAKYEQEQQSLKSWL